MAATPSPIATSFPFILLLSLSLLLLLSLFFRLRTKRHIHIHPPPGCRHGVRLGLHSGALQPQHPPRGGGDGGGKKEEAAAATAAGEESAGGEDKGRPQRARKKRVEVESSGGSEGADEARDTPVADDGGGVGELGGGKMDCHFPFTSFASATQRKMKLQYDEVVKSNKAETLTIAQVGQFVKCLVDAREEIQRKSEMFHRRYKIKRALLLYTANKSSVDRLCQQVNKLQIELKRLEEDETVYTLLQEQLKYSPAYKTMVEASANMEQKVDSDQAMEFPDISFEELLAQEKKDLFWQRNRKLR